MDAWTKRCAVCGRVITQSGRSRRWVHEDQWHQSLGHPARPARSQLADAGISLRHASLTRG